VAGVAQNWDVCVEAPTLWTSSVNHKYSVIGLIERHRTAVNLLRGAFRRPGGPT
jgi:hypothetical protein